MEYFKAESVSEACELKDEYRDEAAFLSGGTDLIVDIREGDFDREYIIDISDLQELSYVDVDDGVVRIGSVTEAVDIEGSDVLGSVPLLKKGFREFANPLVKNQATMGGNIISASPAADMGPLLLVLDAEVTLRSVSGERTIPVYELFKGVKETSEDDDEILTEISFEVPDGLLRNDFVKLSERDANAISTVSLAIMYDVVDGAFKDPRIGMGAVAITPIRAEKTEDVLRGSEVSDDVIEEAKSVLRDEVSPISDVRGSKEYRREVSGELLGKALDETLEGF